VCDGGEVGAPIGFKRLARGELSRVVEIDRTERIDLIYEQRGTELVERRGHWSSAAVRRRRVTGSLAVSEAAACQMSDGDTAGPLDVGSSLEDSAEHA
jgi:hypothetical protein